MRVRDVLRLDAVARNDTDKAQRSFRKAHPSSEVDTKHHVARSHGGKASLLRYLVIGGLSIFIDVGLLYSLHSIVGMQLGIATAVAFLASVVFNFVSNRITMAGSETEQLMRHASRYGLLVLVNLGITVAVVTGAVHVGVPYVVGKLAVVAASTCWNFVLYRRWVFTPSEPRAAG